MKTLQDIKNQYAQEHGYEDWKTFLNYYGGRHPEWFDQHWTEVCIRAQKVALDNAADSAKVQYYNTRTEKKESASAMGNKGQVYSVDRTSITNPKNLIR